MFIIFIIPALYNFAIQSFPDHSIKTNISGQVLIANLISVHHVHFTSYNYVLVINASKSLTIHLSSTYLQLDYLIQLFNYDISVLGSLYQRHSQARPYLGSYPGIIHHCSSISKPLGFLELINHSHN